MRNHRDNILTAIRIGFLVSTFMSTYSAFTSTTLSYTASEEDDKNITYPPDILWLNLLLNLIPALLRATTSYIFQGSRIVENTHGHQDEVAAPRNWKSNSAEILYLLLNYACYVTEDIMMVSGLQGAMYAYRYGHEEILPRPTPALLAVALVWATFIDFPLSMITDAHEVCEEIKKRITGSADNALVKTLSKPLANHCGRLYTIYVLTLGHLMGHGGDLALLPPPDLMIAMAKSHKAAFIASLSLYVLLCVYLLAFNVLQTRKFEIREGLIKLTAIEQNISEEDAIELLPNEVLEVSPKWYRFIRVGLTSQAGLHGIADGIPILLFLRDMLNAKSKSGHRRVPIAMRSGIAFGLFGASTTVSTIGCYLSEVKTALQQIKIRGADEEQKPLLASNGNGNGRTHHSFSLNTFAPRRAQTMPVTASERRIAEYTIR